MHVFFVGNLLRRTCQNHVRRVVIEVTVIRGGRHAINVCDLCQSAGGYRAGNGGNVFFKRIRTIYQVLAVSGHGGRVCRRFLSAVGNPEGDAGGDSLCALERFGNCVDFPDRCAGV